MVCSAHEGETGTDERKQVLTQKKKKNNKKVCSPCCAKEFNLPPALSEFCMMVLMIELYLFMPLSVTLSILQGHSNVEQFYLNLQHSVLAIGSWQCKNVLPNFCHLLLLL